MNGEKFFITLLVCIIIAFILALCAATFGKGFSDTLAPTKQ